MTDYTTIEELDLDPIKVRLMHKESGEGWSLEHANAVEKEYRRFLILMKKYPDEQSAPLMDVDTFWHYHILDTLKYAVDCQAVFGYFLHHFPYIGLRGEEDEQVHRSMGARMKELYEETFGEDYLRAGTTAWSGRATASQDTHIAWSGMATPAATTAWSGAATALAARTAWSGMATPVAKTAWSGRATPLAGQTAWSGRAPDAATPIDGAQIPAVSPVYTVRPRLAQTTA